MFSLLMVTIAVCTLLAGAIPALWDTIPLALAQRLGLAEERVRTWRRWYLLAMVFLLPLVGQLVDSWGGQSILFAGIFASALAIAWFGLAHDARSALVAVVLLAVGATCVILPVIVMLPKTFDFDVRHLYGKTVAAMNLGFVGITLGAILTPGLTRQTLSRLGARNGFLLLALGCLVPATLVALQGQESFTVPVNPLPLNYQLQEVRSWLLGGLGLLFFVLQHLVDSWRMSYLKQAEQRSPLINAGFWCALLGVRLAMGWIIWDQYEPWGLATFAVVYAIVVGNLASASSPNSSPWGFWLVGASFGPLLPTLLAIVVERYPQNPASMVGLLLALGCVSGLLVEPLLDRYVRRTSLPSTMRLSMILALVWGALSLALALTGYLGR